MHFAIAHPTETRRFCATDLIPEIIPRLLSDEQRAPERKRERCGR